MQHLKATCFSDQSILINPFPEQHLPDSHKRMSLLDVPLEILLLIVEQSDHYEANINALARTNRYLYASLNRFLYRHNVERTGGNALSWAAYHGQEGACRKLLAEGADINAQLYLDESELCLKSSKKSDSPDRAMLRMKASIELLGGHCKRTPLSHAAYSGHSAVLRLLLEDNRTDPNRQDLLRGWSRWTPHSTPLHNAVESNNKEALKLLLKNGRTDPNIQDSGSSQTPLMRAIRQGREAMVKLLIEDHRVSLHLPTRYGQTPLSAAAQHGTEAIVKMLLTGNDEREGSLLRKDHTSLSHAAEPSGSAAKERPDRKLADPGVTDCDGRTALSYAACRGKTGMVRILLADERAQPDLADVLGERPLMCALHRGHESVVRLLLPHDRIMSDRTGKSWLAVLEAAADVGEDSIVRLLLTSNRTYRNVESALWYATTSRQTSTVAVLLKDGRVHPDAAVIGDLTVLMIAATRNHIPMMRAILKESCADINFHDSKSRTALWHAAHDGAISAVRFLTANSRIKIDCRDHEGLTPLAIAAVNGKGTIVRLLLEKGANPDVEDHHHRTVLSLAAENERDDIVRTLIRRRRKRADINTRGPHGRTPLWYAAFACRDSVVKILARHYNVKVDLPDDEGRTPLSIAAGIGSCSQVETLLASGADRNIVDHAGKTAMAWATRGGHQAVCELLSADHSKSVCELRVC